MLITSGATNLARGALLPRSAAATVEVDFLENVGRQTKVGQHHRIDLVWLLEQDVLELNVSVHDIFFVAVLEA